MREAEVVIRPPGRWPGLGLRELARYRELMFFLTKRDLQIRYKQSLFGVSWAILQPVAYAAVFAVFIGLIAKIPSDGTPYAVLALAGMVPWIFIAQSVGQAAQSLVAEANLVGKVYFPRLALPIAKVVSFFVDLGIGFGVVLIAVLLYDDVSPTAGILLGPLFMLIALATVLGVGLALATLNVKYRDVTVASPLIIQLWFFATPVLYPAFLIPGDWRYVAALNPAVSVIEGLRWGLIGTRPPLPGAVAVSAVSALVLLAIGVAYFRSGERTLADIV
jgi:lipopolysaccharide transport system permease protein